MKNYLNGTFHNKQIRKYLQKSIIYKFLLFAYNILGTLYHRYKIIFQWYIINKTTN